MNGTKPELVTRSEELTANSAALAAEKLLEAAKNVVEASDLGERDPSMRLLLQLNLDSDSLDLNSSRNRTILFNALAFAAKSPENSVRISAVHALELMNHEDMQGRVVSVLRNGLEDPHYRVRYVASQALSRYPSQQAVDALSDALDTNNLGCQVYAAQALGRMATNYALNKEGIRPPNSVVEKLVKLLTIPPRDKLHVAENVHELSEQIGPGKVKDAAITALQAFGVSAITELGYRLWSLSDNLHKHKS